MKPYLIEVHNLLCDLSGLDLRATSFHLITLQFSVFSIMSFVIHHPSPTNLPSNHSTSRYDVFLSFRGKDLRKGFVDHLHRSLTASGIHAFLDSEELKKGHDIGLRLQEAIRGSAIRIPIFSKNFAASAWCLREISLICKCDGLTIPLFYDVLPSDVRYPESGQFAEAFRKHGSNGRYEKTEIDQWKADLQQVAGKSGWTLEDTAGFEGRLVKLVVDALQITLNRVPLDVAKFPVGVEERKIEVIDRLKLGSDESVLTLGIWGMGGLGKTTLAKAVYNDIYLKFEAACFVSDVRLRAEQSNGICEMQKQILKDLVNFNPDQVNDKAHGKALMKDRLRSINAFVVLDDADHRGQLHELLGDWFGPLSRVLVTTRNRGILNSGRTYEIYEMEGLNKDEALRLFSWHAFSLECPAEGYEDLSEKFAEGCQGLPLSLEVLGAHLCDKRDGRLWLEALDQLQSSSTIADIDTRLDQTLKISYNALNRQEKEIFLDIACCLLGEQTECPVIFWETLYKASKTALRSLKLKSLVKVDDDDRFQMHDHLRDMGRNIESQNPAKRRRLWKLEDARQILQGRKTQNIRCISLESTWDPFGKHPDVTLQTESLASIHNLQLLRLHNIQIEGDIGRLDFPVLRWLQWNSCSLQKLPSEWNMEQLAILDLSSSYGIEELWPEKSPSKTPKNLKVLDMKWCHNLKRVPDLTNCKNSLARLDLSHTSIRRIPDSFRFLKQLKHFDFASCPDLEELPEAIGELSALEKLRVWHCDQIKQLPTYLGGLTALKELKIEYLRVEELPASIGSLCCLEKLTLLLPKLKSLPESIGELRCLSHLDISCKCLTRLPRSIGRLKRLRALRIGDCESVHSLPEELGNLVHLEILHLGNCLNLQELPQNFGLRSLRELRAVRCNLTESGLPKQIGDLSSLKKLDLSENSFGKLPASISTLAQLTHLCLRRCEELLELPILPEGLQYVDISDCSSLTVVSNISHLKMLKDLNLSNCKRLTKLPGLESYQKLEYLNLSNCTKLTELPGLESLQSVTVLDMSGCKKIRTVAAEAMAGLKSLKMLHLRGCNAPVLNIHKWVKEMPFLETLTVSAHRAPQCFQYKMQNSQTVRTTRFRQGCQLVSLENAVQCRELVFCFTLDFGGVEFPVKISIERDGEIAMESNSILVRGIKFPAVAELWLCIYQENHPFMKKFMKNVKSGDWILVDSNFPINEIGMQILYDREDHDVILQNLNKELNSVRWTFKQNEDEYAEDKDDGADHANVKRRKIER